MQAECIICMEHFESSAAISASECGHVFHEACIARWLDESGFLSVGHCPQCRTIVNKVCLTRLFFTDSSVTSRATAVHHQRDIDELQARIDKLTDDCRRKEDSIAALQAECRRKTRTIDELTDGCQSKEQTIEELIDDRRYKQRMVDVLSAEVDELTCERAHKAWTIEQLTADCQQKDESIATLSKTNRQRGDRIVEQTARINQLTKKLESVKTLNEQKIRGTERELASSERKVIALLAKLEQAELNSKLSEESNASLRALNSTQVSRVTELTRTLENKATLSEQKMRAHEKTLASLQAKVNTLEIAVKASDETNAALRMLNRKKVGLCDEQASRVTELTRTLGDKEKALTGLQEKVKALELTREEEETNAELTKRVGLLESEKVRLERACAVQTSKLEFSELLVQLWQNMCERGVNTITQYEHDKKNRQRLDQLTTATRPAEDDTLTPCCAKIRLSLSVCEQELLDARDQLARETRTNAAFDAKLVQLAAQIAHVARECLRRFKTTSYKESGESPDDSGVSNETSRNEE